MNTSCSVVPDSRISDPTTRRRDLLNHRRDFAADVVTGTRRASIRVEHGA
jgi:hypothetical protein